MGAIGLIFVICVFKNFRHALTHPRKQTKIHRLILERACKSNVRFSQCFLIQPTVHQLKQFAIKHGGAIIYPRDFF